MQQTPHVCPHCRQPLWLHRDMWGLYYLCDDCGWTAEDDDIVVSGSASARNIATLVANDNRPPGNDRPRAP